MFLLESIRGFPVPTWLFVTFYHLRIIGGRNIFKYFEEELKLGITNIFSNNAL